MKKYQSHKIVEAAIIVEPNAGGHGTPEGSVIIFTVKDDNESDAYNIELPGDIVSRGSPSKGDYLIKYNGGTEKEYMAWCPKDIFESGNTEIID